MTSNSSHRALIDATILQNNYVNNMKRIASCGLIQINKLAEGIGLSPSYFSQIKTANFVPMPRIDTLCSISQYFAVDFLWIVEPHTDEEVEEVIRDAIKNKGLSDH